MRVLVMFDMPVDTSENRREYAKFRRYLVKSGFVMLQESVYSKIAVNPVMGELISEGVRKHKPKTGLVQLLKITEKQFAAIECIVGERHSDVLDTDEKLVVI